MNKKISIKQFYLEAKFQKSQKKQREREREIKRMPSCLLYTLIEICTFLTTDF